MADYTVTITKDNTGAIKRQLEENLTRALEAIGLQAEGYAKLELENNPRRIDTGNLRNSITHAVAEDEQAVYIGSAVSYAAYVHEGTSRMEPNRYLKNAVEKNMGEYGEILESVLKSSM